MINIIIQSEPSSNYRIPYYEWLALKDFYNSTSGNEWLWEGNSSRWNFTNYLVNNPCQDNWIGIVCFCYRIERSHYSIYYSYAYSAQIKTNCYIEKLVLIRKHLRGTIPSSITKFSHLKRLILRRNDLYGSIPAEIGLLSNLTRLVLGYYNFYYCNIMETIYNIASNRLSGPLPNSIGNLKDLNYLSLRSNFITGK